ncbi:MAG: ABC transporter permease subunit [Planctomycetes bacterium]|nr:ABC transporter permease subunit [Planctomycetota bacterium]MBI3833322.1 ABC transporter permease subunit [Planctomycetota bacterium]
MNTAGVPANTFTRRLWLSLWHLLPGNPILVRVVNGSSRRVRHLWLRVIYLSSLLAVVLFSLLSSGGQHSSLTDLAKSASQTFAWASTAQLMLMCFLAPVFTASAITQERDAQTFNILLSTPLSNAQIVLGSLMSRLYFVIMLLVAGLPIFLMTMVYGGVTTRQIIESFALSGSTAILTGALAIFIAMVGVGTRRTIFSFYLLIALYLLTFYLLGQWSKTWVDGSPPNVAGTKMSWLAPLHPFLALEVAINRVHAPTLAQLGDHGSIARSALAYPSAAFVSWTTLTSLALISFSLFFVRRGAKSGESKFWTSLVSRFRRKSQGERTRTPRNVWSNPVAWREAKTRIAGGAFTRWAVILAGFGAAIDILLSYARGTLPLAEAPYWFAGLIVVQFALAMLIATNTAATAMTKEKEGKTMDLLLTTPLTSKYILWGKLRGIVSFAAPLLAGPLGVLTLFVIIATVKSPQTPPVWLEAPITLSALILIYTAIACVVGLRFSLISRTNMVAVMSSVGVMVLLCGLASMIGFAIVQASSGEFGAFLAPFTPFTAIKFLVDPGSLFGTPKDFAEGAGMARTAALTGSIAALLLYAFMVWRWYTGLVRDFDMTIRKQTGH